LEFKIARRVYRFGFRNVSAILKHPDIPNIFLVQHPLVGSYGFISSFIAALNWFLLMPAINVLC
jgi:hypothetical protein